ncbi:MAG: hypothetical protein ACKVS7_11415, partial [Gemmatimonadaceae bacterium]
RGLRSPTALVFTLLMVVAACAEERRPVVNNTRREVRLVTQVQDSSTACTQLPDTLAEVRTAIIDKGDIPDARVVLDPACPRGSIGYTANSHIQRTYRVQVPAGRTLVARARGEFAGVTMAFDYPATADTSGANVGRVRVDSILATQDREIAVRVMLVPKLRVEPRTSRVLLTLLVR